jgi:hypothetical protein
MEDTMHRLASAALAGALPLAALAAIAGCRLDPLVDDTPGASAHLFPAGGMVPSAADSPELANQIGLNDGIDDKVLTINNGVVPRGTGLSAGQPVRYWSFGLANRAPAPLYQFFSRDDQGAVKRLDHPPMIEANPGERSYNPLHAINRVVVTAAYKGELITSAEALSDALDLGLIEEPEPTGDFVASPIVLLGTKLEISSKPAVVPIEAQEIYGHGYRVGMFELGGARGVQPTGGFLPTNQVSFLRESNKPGYDTTRPIFQATVPAAPPMMSANYTPLSVVVNVDLRPGVSATDIKSDGDLFVRDPNGAIVGTTEAVQALQVTGSILVLPLQFTEDVP